MFGQGSEGKNEVPLESSVGVNSSIIGDEELELSDGRDVVTKRTSEVSNVVAEMDYDLAQRKVRMIKFD